MLTDLQDIQANMIAEIMRSLHLLAESAPEGLRWKTYPNNARTDGSVFVAEDKPIVPYENINLGGVGQVIMPSLPDRAVSFPMSMPARMGEWLVEVLNARTESKPQIQPSPTHD